jgi:hypothetical protein
MRDKKTHFEHSNTVPVTCDMMVKFEQLKFDGVQAINHMPGSKECTEE